MGKAVLHSLIDMLNDTDTETIYNILIRFAPSDNALEDEVSAIEQSKIEIANGDVVNFSELDWDV